MSSDNSNNKNAVSGTSIPDRVVRFYGNNDYALECISLNQITFIRSTKLNDPFDPWLNFITDFKDYEELSLWIKKNRPHKFKTFTALITKENFETNLRRVKDKAKKMIGELFIFSTCAVIPEQDPKNNLYMWSHYAYGHRGIAIEFDGQILNDKMKEIGVTDNVLTQIKYSDNTPKISSSDMYEFLMMDNPEKIAAATELSASIKSSFWQIENEWRLTEKNDEVAMDIIRRPLPINAITKIYLGCTISDYWKNKLLLETKRVHPKAEIYQAHKLTDKFGLSFEKL